MRDGVLGWVGRGPGFGEDWCARGDAAGRLLRLGAGWGFVLRGFGRGFAGFPGCGPLCGFGGGFALSRHGLLLLRRCGCAEGTEAGRRCRINLRSRCAGEFRGAPAKCGILRCAQNDNSKGAVLSQGGEGGAGFVPEGDEFGGLFAQAFDDVGRGFGGEVLVGEA